MKQLSPAAVTATFLLGGLVASALAIYILPEPWWLLAALSLAALVATMWFRRWRPLAVGALVASIFWGVMMRLISVE